MLQNIDTYREKAILRTQQVNKTNFSTLIKEIIWWNGPKFLDENEANWPKRIIKKLNTESETHKLQTKTTLFSITGSIPTESLFVLEKTHCGNKDYYQIQQ